MSCIRLCRFTSFVPEPIWLNYITWLFLEWSCWHGVRQWFRHDPECEEGVPLRDRGGGGEEPSWEGKRGAQRTPSPGDKHTPLKLVPFPPVLLPLSSYHTPTLQFYIPHLVPNCSSRCWSVFVLYSPVENERCDITAHGWDDTIGTETRSYYSNAW